MDIKKTISCISKIKCKYRIGSESREALEKAIEALEKEQKLDDAMDKICSVLVGWDATKRMIADQLTTLNLTAAELLQDKAQRRI